MDRTAWIVSTLCVIGIVLIISTTPKPPPPPQRGLPAPSVSATPAALAAPTAASTPVSISVVANGISASAVASSTPPPPVMEAREESLDSTDSQYVFNNDAGGIEKVVLLKHLGENDGSISLNRDRGMPIGAFGLNPGQVIGGFEMKADKAKSEVVFTKTDTNGLIITKKFILPPKGSLALNTVGLEVSFTNPRPDPLRMPDFFVSAGGAAPVHVLDNIMNTRFDWFADRKADSINVTWFNASSFLGLFQMHPERQVYDVQKPDVKWVAVSSQYFTTVLTARERGSSVWAKRFDTHKPNNSPVYGIQGAIGLAGFTIEPGQTVTKSFDIYSGPKDISTLQGLGMQQDKILNLGWFWWISQGLQWMMNWLHGIVGSYAAAIILLTLIIKSLLWPVQNKATNEMRKMSALGPKMAELKEKFKDNPQKMNEETMKLYRDYGVNPFSGCIPMLFQIPIFFGFYAMLGSAIELRNSSFLWIHDLSQPDTIGHVLGYPVNLLPIIMAGTMVWQMTITPKSGDAAQQRILYIMPVVFLLFSYNYASALALYWTTQNMFSIVQLYLTRNRPLPKLVKKSAEARLTGQAQKKKKKFNL